MDTELSPTASADRGPDKVIREGEFAQHLCTATAPFHRSLRQLLALGPAQWRRRHLNQLVHDAHLLEYYLDEFGARYNRRFHGYTELIAALKGIGTAAYGIAHVRQRMESYSAESWQPQGLAGLIRPALDEASDQLHTWLVRLLHAALEDARREGFEPPQTPLDQEVWLPVEVRRRLPRNLGQDELENEEQRIADVAAKFIQAADLLERIGSTQGLSPVDRRQLLGRNCSEEQARVYEATVHNLQSSYDTFVRNTILEARDPRLKLLRGQASAALHCLEAATELVHFVERHASPSRLATEESVRRLVSLVPEEAVDRVVVDLLLGAAQALMVGGRSLAEDLLPQYSRVGELAVELLDGLSFHARPAALVFGIVQHHGLPVELEIAGRVCNAGSILEMLLAVGTAPDERRFVFRGDERPLKDIQALFESGLGEQLGGLPSSLQYLRRGSS
jgi:GNAT superfamily N-acetyltransferase/phosphotransferase system HPr-like phosphotransfer protein